jgi:hypothetical protein
LGFSDAASRFDSNAVAGDFVPTAESPDAAAELARGGIASAAALADDCFKAVDLGGPMPALGRRRALTIHSIRSPDWF